MLLSFPVTDWEVVLGKFFAALGLVSVALALTLPYAFFVAAYGPLDKGPAIGGYLGLLCMAAGYLAKTWDAQRFAEIVARRRNNQGVYLLGYSFAGYLAYDVAGKLGQGRDVLLLESDQVSLVGQEPGERAIAKVSLSGQKGEVAGRGDSPAGQVRASLPRPPGT